MSEFKFACPICGQHITADSKDTGSQIPCPTCYRKIVVPQAPATDDPKFVLSASEANKPRPTSILPPGEGIQRGPIKTAIPVALFVWLVLACGAGATLYALRGKFHPKPPVEEAKSNPKPETPPQPEYTGTNRWTLDLSKAEFPDMPAAGSVHRRAFELDRASLSGSNLTLRVGRSGTVELGLNVVFFNRAPEDLSGKSAEVKPEDTTAPKVVLHWKEEERKSETFRSGYAMKIQFGPLSNNVLPGKIFLCLPDGAESWIAGTFRAEIHKPGPPRPRPPAPRPPPQHQPEPQTQSPPQPQSEPQTQ
jgi:DNA-directed RNA polymerase subunit RPC12/RpoP